MSAIKVLLVDDEKPFVETMSKRLEKRGLEVVQAFGGQEALEALARTEEGPGLSAVILDVKMPVMDGLEVLSRIKRDFPLVEVIMLTGHATVESAIEGMKRGAFDYLMKPCDMEVLMAKVKEADQKKRDQEERLVRARAEMIALRRGD